MHLSDHQIEDFIAEQKTIPRSSINTDNIRTRHGFQYSENLIDFRGEDGSRYRLILKQLLADSEEFSVILGLVGPRLFRLMRFNGNHIHGNRLEGNTINGFHIHLATERYQMAGMKEDAFAEVTTRYANIRGALNCMITDCNIAVSGDETDLFGNH